MERMVRLERIFSSLEDWGTTLMPHPLKLNTNPNIASL